MAINFEIDNTDLEIFTLIWLDASINEIENKQTQEDLRKLSSQLKIFDNNNQCELYIQSLSINEYAILIVSGRLSGDIIPRIHDIKQISSIYIYCFDKNIYEEWAKTYSKIRNILTTKDELIEEICFDNKKEISSINDDLLYINIFMNNFDNQFIYSQLLIDYLLKIKLNLPFNEQFFTLYKTEYIENNIEIKNFEKIQKNFFLKNILWWLTKDKYLSKLISKIFYTKNIDLLYLLYYIINDINHQLELNQCSTTIHVYHSHLITNEQIEQLKNSIGKFISINNFILTTFERHNALMNLKQTNNLQKILFEIYADPSINDIKPFADITSFSYFSKQSQILFMLGSIFYIKKFYQQNDIWICEMILSSKNNPELKTIFEQIQNQDGDYNHIISFGNILTRIGQYNDAEKYYQRLLNELLLNNEETYTCYFNLGNIYFNKKDYNQTIDYYKKALNILGITTNINSKKVSICLKNLGRFYIIQRNYIKAQEYYEKALNIEEEYLSENEVNLGQTYHNIGAIYWCRGFYDKAMKYYNLSLENKAKYLPSNHLYIAMTLENIGLINENKKNFHEAFQYYEKAANIYQQNLSSTDSNFIQIKDNILRVSSYLK